MYRRGAAASSNRCFVKVKIAKNILPLRRCPDSDVALSSIVREIRPLIETMYSQKGQQIPVDQINKPTPTDEARPASSVISPSLMLPDATVGNTKVYKGVGVGTYLHQMEPRIMGFGA